MRNRLLPVLIEREVNFSKARKLSSITALNYRSILRRRHCSFQLMSHTGSSMSNDSTWKSVQKRALSTGASPRNGSTDIGTTQEIQSDNPCWGSTDQCDLQYLLTKIKKEKVVIFESEHYCVINKPPDLRMDGPYAATVHKLLTYWYPPPSIYVDNKQDLLQAVSKLHQHNHVRDNALRPCHQLDYATSGILCVARNHEAASTAGPLWEDRKVSKSYLAVVTGQVNPNDELPVLTMEEVKSTLAKLEQSYRNKRRQPKSNTTFNGFMPPHTIFGKWKSVKKSCGSSTARSSNKNKRKRSTLNDGQWSLVWTPVNKIVPDSTVDMDWKELCKHHVHWKKAFQHAATIHNDLLRTAQETDNEETTSTLPTIFRVDQDIYIFCPLAEALDGFVMNVPPSVAKSYPTVAKFAGTSDDQDFKPSLTKCTILQRATYQGKSVTKVRLWPITGRRHQLRVHTALCGHAILGDASYGSCFEATEGSEEERRLPPRMCLHAQYLSLPLLGESKDWSVTTADPFLIEQAEVVLTSI
jgi:23S rRNA-/tRNA-specific pseudouridylate synthase